MKSSKAVLVSVFLGVFFIASSSFAVPIILTGDSLGVQGDQGHSLSVSSDLTLTALTQIGKDDKYDGEGTAGTVYVDQTEGIGVRGPDGQGSTEISGLGGWGDESLVFNFLTEVDPSSIIVGLNHISFSADDVTLFIQVFSSSDVTVPESSIEVYFQWTGSDIGFLEFGDLSEISGIDSITSFHVEAVDGHFYVNSIDYAPVIPEPSTILLLGAGLFGMVGLKRKNTSS